MEIIRKNPAFALENLDDRTIGRNIAQTAEYSAAMTTVPRARILIAAGPHSTHLSERRSTHKERGSLMRKFNWVFCAAMLIPVANVWAQTNDFATGNMHFDAKAMDTNGDHMISKDEYMKYGETMWGMMAKSANALSVNDAARDFAQGNLRFSAKAMDANHDGSITKEEFMTYAQHKFDKMKDAGGMMSVDDAATKLARGNTHAK
jgi:hypothetical protein